MHFSGPLKTRPAETSPESDPVPLASVFCQIPFLTEPAWFRTCMKPFVPESAPVTTEPGSTSFPEFQFLLEPEKGSGVDGLWIFVLARCCTSAPYSQTSGPGLRGPDSDTGLFVSGFSRGSCENQAASADLDQKVVLWNLDYPGFLALCHLHCFLNSTWKLDEVVVLFGPTAAADLFHSEMTAWVEAKVRFCLYLNRCPPGFSSRHPPLLSHHS